MAVPSPSKATLRRELKIRRRTAVEQMNDRERRDAANAVANIVLAQLGNAQLVASYLPIEAEIDAGPLNQRIAALAIALALPRISSPAEPMQFHRWRIDDVLETGPFGLAQPSADAEIVTPDVILTPVLGFDQMLSRIGYGAGYYDRAFAISPMARRIGLAWAFQECDRIPSDPWDIALNAVATPHEWIKR